MQEMLKTTPHTQFGEHLCCVYESVDDKLSMIVPFISIGLELNEKCVCIADQLTLSRVEKALERIGVDVTLFRVVQEALTNIVKHSQASQANVLLKGASSCLQVEIFDNGIGFDPSSVLGSANLEKGIGLVSMRERVELLGGDMIVRSELGKGTTISVRVPIKETKISPCPTWTASPPPGK